MTLLRFFKDWTLPIAILTGIVAYLLYANLSVFDFFRPYANRTVSVVQPALIFMMLFLSFCKIDARQLRPSIPNLWLLLIQCSSFALLGLLLYFLPNIRGRVIIEGAMLCMICPTAAAAAVVTQKLDGNVPDITMYTILINVAVAIIVPAVVPLIHPQSGQSFISSSLLILYRVFPLLICPLIAAQFVRYCMPRFHRYVSSFHDLAFYLWAVCLSIAIAITTRSIAHATEPLAELIGLALASLVCCVFQFWIGRKIGACYGLRISASQGLGQKNTAFAIWLGYTFLNPATSLAGGLYSIWHNLYNTYQLRNKAKTQA